MVPTIQKETSSPNSTLRISCRCRYCACHHPPVLCSQAQWCACGILHFPLPSTCFLYHKTCSVCSAIFCKSFPDLLPSVFSFLPLLSSSPDFRQRPFLCKYLCSSLYVESFPFLASYCCILHASSFTSSALSWAVFAMNIRPRVQPFGTLGPLEWIGL